MHWMRVPIAPSIDWETARASTVFAVPGTSSKSTWPLQASAVRTRRISSRFPCTTVSMFASSLSATSTASRRRSVSATRAVTPTSVVRPSRVLRASAGYGSIAGSAGLTAVEPSVAGRIWISPVRSPSRRISRITGSPIRVSGAFPAESAC